MDLRTKLIFAFVATSLASMFLLGTFTYAESANALRDAREEQLRTLAKARASDLAVVVQSLRDQVGIIHGGPVLQSQVAAYRDDPAGTRPVIRQIIQGAEANADIITRITVYDTEGELIARAGGESLRYRLLGTLEFPGGQTTRYYQRPGARPDQRLATVMASPLVWEDRVVGRIETELEVGTRLDLPGTSYGLGESSEMIVPMEFEPGVVTFLTPLRRMPTDSMVVMPLDSASLPVRMAVRRDSGLVVDSVDYAGVPVWAAVQPIADLPTGVVVKVDVDEELRPVRELRERLIAVGLSVAALAILAGSLVGSLMARRLRRLNDVVRTVRSGEVGLRADEAGEDEVSFLAESFNRLMDHIEGRSPK